MTLLGSVGWAAEEASRRLWWPSPDWRKAGETRRGGGEYQWKVKFYLPLRESCGFSPGDGRILPLSYTAETSVAAAERPQTPPSRAAPHIALCCYPHLSVGSLPAPYPAWCRWGGGWLREGLMA